MKSKVLMKACGMYALFAVASFLMIYLFGTARLRAYRTGEEGDALYAEASSIASSYAEQFYTSDITLEELYTQLSVLSEYLESDIRVITTTGRVMIDTDTAYTYDITEQEVIEAFDPTSSGSKTYSVGTFYDCFEEDMLNVIAPVTVGYSVRGYVTIHRTMEAVTEGLNETINIFYLIYVLILICALIILIIVYVLFLRPVRALRNVAQEYARHDFSQSVPLRGNRDELHELGSALQSMGTELNTLEEDQKKFISNVSHDFRSPLTTIRGYADAMLDGTIPPQMQKKYLEIIVFETQRLTKLTQNILDLNKYSGSATLLHRTRFDIHEVIKTTAASFEVIGREKGMRMDLILSGQTMYVWADQDRIQQVLYNLIDNAMKFGYPDTVVTVETTVRSGKVYVSVRDNGVGIAKENLSRIWERFYKTDSSRGKDKKGSGLGLSIVKEIIQSHGETINVVSTENAGTDFTFTLALSEEN